MPQAYDSLAPQFRAYVDALLAHAETALWPERRAALESFYRGIARSTQEDLQAAGEALGLETGPGEDLAELVFRRVLTAYLSRLDETDITNRDQAQLYLLSLDPDLAARAERWLAARAKAEGES